MSDSPTLKLAAEREAAYFKEHGRHNYADCDCGKEGIEECADGLNYFHAEGWDDLALILVLVGDEATRRIEARG